MLPSHLSASRAPLLVWLLALVNVLSGCGDPSFADCPDAGCRTRTVELAYHKDPAAVLAYLASGPDPVEAAALVDILAHYAPSDQPKLCAAVAPGSLAAERCQRLQLRPHLYSTSEGSPVENRRPLPKLSAPWRSSDLPPTDPGCKAGCLGDLAYNEASMGRVLAAGALCDAAWPAKSRAREECLFQVAEHAAPLTAAGGMKTLFATCSQAGEFAANCFQHVLLLAQPSPPAADRTDMSHLSLMIEHAAEIEAALGADAGQDVVDLSWALWTRDAYREANVIDGALYAALPERALPHARAAAAFRAIALANHPPFTAQRSAEELGKLLFRRATLARGGGASGPQPRDRFTASSQVRQLWAADVGPREAATQPISCLGGGRRLAVEDPEADLLLAVLEAAARRSTPVEPDFFAALLGSTSPEEVRWTAARILSEVYPQVSATYAGRDSSAWVETTLTLDRRPALDTLNK